MSETVQVPTGSFKGRVTDIVQFKNVPYAAIEKRFTFSKIKTDFGDLDCTEQGSLCPQHPPYRDSYLGIAEENVREIKLDFDEFNCLNCMITAPKGPRKNLPVVVWVHGGGDIAGTAYRAVNDPSAWVKRGQDIGKPFIVVTLQFRVQLFGFLPFNGVGNYGLQDQQVGLQWVQKYISYFGGDASKVTLVGQSSGSHNVWAQSCVEKPLFQQLACLSGALLPKNVRSLEEYYKITERVCAHLKCEPAYLQECPWQDLVDAFLSLKVPILSPVDDGVFLPKGAWATALPHVDRLIVGDLIEDGQFFLDDLAEGVFVKAISPLFGPAIKGQYPLETDADACRLMTDYVFGTGNHKLDEAMRAKKCQVMRQLFDAVNPIVPERGNIHMVELLYLLQSYEILPGYEQLAKAVQDLWAGIVSFEPLPEVVRVAEQVTIHPLQDLHKYRVVDKYKLLEGNVDPRIFNQLTGW